MAGRTERIVISIAGGQVGIQYEPVTEEACGPDKQFALEFSLHALNRLCRNTRMEAGLEIPDAMTALDSAETFWEFVYRPPD